MASWTLKRGERGTKVRRMQAALKRNPFARAFGQGAGFYTGAVDGVFGPATRTAVKKAKFALGYSRPNETAGYLLLAFLERRLDITTAMRKRRVARIEAYESARGFVPRISRPKGSWRYPLAPRIGRVKYFICHYSASPASTTAATIHQWHRASMNGIGYNAVIEKDGTIVMGRPWSRAGAHTMHFNNEWAVCLPGDNTAPPTSAQLRSLKWLIGNRQAASKNTLMVRGHNEMPGNPTSCPGKYWPWPGVR